MGFLGLYDTTILNEPPFGAIFGLGRKLVGRVKMFLVLKHSPSDG